MKLHNSIVDKLLFFCSQYSGYATEKRLADSLNSMRLSEYLRTDENARNVIVLVDTNKYLQEAAKMQRPAGNIIPMKLHSTAVNKIMRLHETLGGYNQETRLRNSFAELDFTVYKSKTTGEVFIIPTEDYLRILHGST